MEIIATKFLVTPALLLSVAAQADMASLNLESEYQFELRGSYTYDDQPIASLDFDSQAYGVEASYFYAPVKLGQQPYAEAAFLQGVSSLELSMQRRETESRFTDCASCNAASSTYDYLTLTSRSYVADYLYLEGTYSYSDYEYQSFNSTSSNDSDFWFASIGVMPLEGLLITTDFNKRNSLFENGWNLGAKYVVPVTETAAINMEATYSDPDIGDDTWLLEADYYFTPTLSLGGSYSTQSELYTARSTWYWSKSFAVDVEYQEQYLGDSYTIGVSTRF
ncbi:putative porin [Gilvimarinus sp. SDUM040013]|uniref:Porin n=1 Tax=Gilvimarinus gilvus TaxID=3058038 RepID=A0ABU4RYV2_9GAMM|nr:putative porin [Gilvimarinus sp. SDUM040013]MDO3384598.1 putative porin [Gilvimarinus sp. SDUM040013]MDX6850066.1 putative porin [Gilvimarinus sp. SDUM040013]